MSSRPSDWTPVCGLPAIYVGRHHSGARRERRVEVLAEASGGRMVVAAIGKAGAAVRIVVKAENLKPVMAGLFD